MNFKLDAADAERNVDDMRDDRDVSFDKDARVEDVIYEDLGIDV